MIRISLFLLLMSAAPAVALSCLRPDAVRLYENARDSERVYYLVRGQVELTGAVRRPQPNSQAAALTKARVTGLALSGREFGASFDRSITVEAHCLGPWCGGPDGTKGEHFLALEIREDELFLRMGPCGGDAVLWDMDAEHRVLSCHAGDSCTYRDDF